MTASISGSSGAAACAAACSCSSISSSPLAAAAAAASTAASTVRSCDAACGAPPPPLLAAAAERRRHRSAAASASAAAPPRRRTRRGCPTSSSRRRRAPAVLRRPAMPPALPRTRSLWPATAPTRPGDDAAGAGAGAAAAGHRRRTSATAKSRCAALSVCSSFSPSGDSTSSRCSPSGHGTGVRSTHEPVAVSSFHHHLSATNDAPTAQSARSSTTKPFTTGQPSAACTASEFENGWNARNSTAAAAAGGGRIAHERQRVPRSPFCSPTFSGAQRTRPASRAGGTEAARPRSTARRGRRRRWRRRRRRSRASGARLWPAPVRRLVAPTRSARFAATVAAAAGWCAAPASPGHRARAASLAPSHRH